MGNQIQSLKFSPVTDKEEISKAQDTIEKSWKSSATKYENIKLGTKHGNDKFNCYYIETFGVWAAFDFAPAKPPYNRFWNAFGLGKLNEDLNNNIICEINFSFTGDRKVAGLIAEDETGNKHIIHSGRIGGNYKKEDFWDRYNREACYVSVEKDVVKKYAYISRLNSDLLMENIVDFISEVNRIKNI
ncbi:MAG: hypothetical protein ABIB41_09950 [Nitrospirota bacterium]